MFAFDFDDLEKSEKEKREKAQASKGRFLERRTLSGRCSLQFKNGQVGLARQCMNLTCRVAGQSAAEGSKPALRSDSGYKTEVPPGTGG